MDTLDLNLCDEWLRIYIQFGITVYVLTTADKIVVPMGAVLKSVLFINNLVKNYPA